MAVWFGGIELVPSPLLRDCGKDFSNKTGCTLNKRTGFIHRWLSSNYNYCKKHTHTLIMQSVWGKPNAKRPRIGWSSQWIGLLFSRPCAKALNARSSERCFSPLFLCARIAYVSILSVLDGALGACVDVWRRSAHFSAQKWLPVFGCCYRAGWARVVKAARPTVVNINLKSILSVFQFTSPARR